MGPEGIGYEVPEIPRKKAFSRIEASSSARDGVVRAVGADARRQTAPIAVRWYRLGLARPANRTRPAGRGRYLPIESRRGHRSGTTLQSEEISTPRNTFAPDHLLPAILACGEV